MGARRKPCSHAARARANRRVYDAAYLQRDMVLDAYAYLNNISPSDGRRHSTHSGTQGVVIVWLGAVQSLSRRGC